MSTITDLLIGLGIDAGEYAGGLDDASAKSSSFIDKVTGPLTTAMVGAFAAGGAAVGAFAVTSVNKFADFQTSMNEVFTLLPDLSEDAMSDMTDQVKQFSKDFGVLPEDTVPALYQSLSAGVPADNVFAFMEEAHKAATAGVTDLSVAVDGISSVVNAYGSDVIDAGKASDLMFTAVKLGKTTFDDISSSLFNVTPAAAAAGVKFEEVTASLAAMTLQGVPTNVATTKLRAAINELSSAGSETAKTFESIAGKSFKEFLAAGGTMQEALQLMEQHAKDTGVGINDLFGSVEAGSAALLLTGKGTDAFNSALEGMANSAGATDTAFATMNTGITDAVDDMKAVFAVFMLDIGERLAPFVQMFADQLGVILPQVIDVVIGFIDRLFLAFNNLSMAVESAGGSITGIFTVFEDGSSAFTSVLEMFGVGYDTALMFNNALLALYEAIKPLFPVIEQIGVMIGDNFGSILKAVAVVIGVVVVGAIGSFIASILSVIAPIIAVIAIVAALFAAYENNFLGIRDIVNTVITFISTLITEVMSAVAAFWSENGAAIMATALEVWTFIQNIVKMHIDAISAIIRAVTTAITFIWRNYGDELTKIASNFWNMIKGIFSAAFTLISGLFKAFNQLISGDFRGAGQTLLNTARSFMQQIWNVAKLWLDNLLLTFKIVWDLIYRAVQAALDSVVSWIRLTFQSIVSAVRSFASVAAGAAASVGEGIVSGITKAIESGVSSIINAAKNAAMDALNAAKSALGIGSPSKVAINEIGVPFMQGIVIGVDQMLSSVGAAGASAGLALASGATATVPAITGAASSGAAVGATGEAAGGMTQNFQIDAHYSKYQDERTLRDTIRMEAALNAPALG